jgi:hypothetical protein
MCLCHHISMCPGAIYSCRSSDNYLGITWVNDPKPMKFFFFFFAHGTVLPFMI